MQTKLDDSIYRHQLGDNVQHVRRRAFLALDDENWGEVAKFSQANRITAVPGDDWTASYAQALALYNEILANHGQTPVDVPVPPEDETQKSYTALSDYLSLARRISADSTCVTVIYRVGDSHWLRFDPKPLVEADGVKLQTMAVFANGYRDFGHITQAAIDWQYLVVKSGGMARKSDCETWLIYRFGLTSSEARFITNGIEAENKPYFNLYSDKVAWNPTLAGRPEPQEADYPDFTLGGMLGRL